MKVLNKILIKYEGEEYHSMSKQTWKQFKTSENQTLSLSLVWGCSMFLVFDISMLVLMLTNIISNGTDNSLFLMVYHVSLLSIFSLAVIALSIRERHPEIKWLNKINAGLLLSILVLFYTTRYTIYEFNITGNVIVYAVGLIFCVNFLRERPLINTIIYLSFLTSLIVSALFLVQDSVTKQSIVFYISIITAFTILMSTNIFRHRLKSLYTNEQLNKLVTIDTLTGLNNRFSYNQYISEGQVSYPAVICTLDMDNLKTVNDTLGHLEGDRCLKAIANCLSAAFEFSFLARIGGDEFVAIINDTTLKATFPKIDKFRDLIAEHKEGLPCISVSLGYCKIKKNLGYNEAYIKAETMMYQEKNKKKMLA